MKIHANNYPAASVSASAEGEKSFQLVEYYSVTSLVIILLFALGIAWMVSRRNTEMVIAKQGQFAQLLAENLNHQVMNRFVITALREYGGVNVGQPEQFKLLDAVVRNTIPLATDDSQTFRVLKVNILDLEGNIIYSTQPEYIGRVGDEGAAFRIASSGGSSNSLQPEVEMFTLGQGPRRIMRTLIPLRDQRRRTAELGPPRAVFEIEMDVSGDFQQVWHGQLLVVAILVLMMVVLFVILRTIVMRGQRVMGRQSEERAQLLEQLNQSERLASLGRMIAGVAHEIRNPLGIIRSTAELLGSRADAASKPLAGVIVEESNRLNQIVTEFLDFARPQRPNLTPVVLDEVINRNLTMLEPEILRLGVNVVRQLRQPPLVVVGDADLLYRALLNIFNNAVQAMDEGGILKVSTFLESHDGREWGVVAVDDSGPGIDPQTRANILEPFFTTKEKGTGLGLSIVNSIVASHGGKLSIESSAQGGARIKVRLVLAEQ